MQAPIEVQDMFSGVIVALRSAGVNCQRGLKTPLQFGHGYSTILPIQTVTIQVDNLITPPTPLYLKRGKDFLLPLS